MRSFTLSEVASVIGGSIPHDVSSIVAKGVNVDSRLVLPGNLFFALPGARVDGHDYLFEIAAKGAVAAIVSRTDLLVEGLDIPLIVVKDVLEALQKLTRYFISQARSKIVAVTGSIGKTTTKDLLTTLLKEKYSVAASPGNSNSQVGLPLTILNHTNGEEEILVLEMGMTHPGQISQLVQLAPPDIALITSVDLVHAVNFDSLEEIAAAKGEIFSHPKTSLGVLSKDISSYSELLQIGSCSKVSFSVTSDHADYSLCDLSEVGFHVKEWGRKSPVLSTLNIAGKHNYHNFLAAVVVARTLGLEWEEIEGAIPKLTLPERRLQLVERNGVLFLNDAYNATATSVKAALSTLPTPKAGGRKIAVIGEMMELGKFSESCHRDVGLVALETVDLLFCLGAECVALQRSWQEANRTAPLFMERFDLVNELRQHLKSGDVVLLKGSRSKEMWKILEEM